MIERTLTFMMVFPTGLLAGTGHTKDIDLMYLLLLSLLGLVILIWEGIDFIGKNRQKINLEIRKKILEFSNLLSKFRRLKHQVTT